MRLPTVDTDYEAIPPTVKRKCFSTLERLRLAQPCTAAKPSSSASWDPSPFKAPRTPKRPSLNRSKSSSYLRPSSRRTKKAPTNDNLSTTDAQWFLRLPEKVQRRHFTPDEQRMLAGHCEEVILDATDTILFRLGHQSNRSVPSLRPSSSSTTSSNSSRYFEAEQDLDETVDMDDSMLENFRWMDENNNLDLTLDDYHIHVIEAAGAKCISDRRPSFHKNPSISALPLHGSSPPSSSRGPSTRTTTPIPRISLDTSHHRDVSHASTANFLPIHQNRDSTDPAARHYRDPDTRLKLRVYLASPSKFDEAIEFGFPALPGKPSRPSLSNRRCATAPADPETFYDDHSPTLLNALDMSDNDDSSSLPDVDPLTPSSTSFHNTHRLPSSKRASSEYIDLQTSIKPRIRYLSTEPPSPSYPGAREMTLRMTLTRSDLRDEQGPEKAQNDPLALDELPPAQNGRNIWDRVPREKGWKRVWKRVSGKTCLEKA